MDKELNTCANELEALVQQEGNRKAAPGGVISAVLALVAAIRGGDVKTIMVAVRDLLNVFIGETGGDINFAPAVGAGFDWKSLLAILAALLGALGK